MSHLSKLLTAAALCLLVAPAAASADVSLSNVVAHPITPGATCTTGIAANAPAAAHRDLCVSFDVGQTGSDDLRGLTLHLAPGLIGDPNAADKCPQAAFVADACAATAQVGTVATTAQSLLGDLNLTGQVFNLVPAADEPARLGIFIQPLNGLAAPIHIQSSIRIRLDDFGLDSITRDDVPRQATLLGLLTSDITVTHMALTLWGPTTGHLLHAPFITVPTNCRPATTAIDARAWDGTATGGSDTFTPTDCASVPYAPQLTATIGASGQTAKRTNPPLTTVVTQQPGEANSSHVEVTLPAGLGANAAGLARACPVAQLEANACPPSAVVGSVRADTPLLPTPLEGPVLIVKPASGPLPELSLELRGGINLRLRASVGFGTGGRLKTIFDGIPDVPLSRLALTLDGGKDGILTTGRDLCAGTATTLDALFRAHSGAQRTATVAAKVPCGAATALALKGLKGTATLTGVKHKRPALRLKLSAPVRVRAMQVTLPSQLRSRGGLARLAKVVAGGRGVRKPSVRAKGRTLTVKLPKAGTLSPDLRLRAGALRLAGKLKVGQRVTIKVTATRLDGKKLTATLRARVSS